MLNLQETSADTMKSRYKLRNKKKNKEYRRRDEKSQYITRLINEQKETIREKKETKNKPRT